MIRMTKRLALAHDHVEIVRRIFKRKKIVRSCTNIKITGACPIALRYNFDRVTCLIRIEDHSIQNVQRHTDFSLADAQIV